LRVLQIFRDLTEAIQSLTTAVQSLELAQAEDAPSEARLDDLERSRSLWEAQMDAILVKADSTLKSANNAESRARTMKRAYERLDPFDEEGEEVETAVPSGHVENGEEQEVLPLRVDVAPTGKALATRLKFLGG